MLATAPPTETVPVLVAGIDAIPESFWQVVRSGDLGRLQPGESLEIVSSEDPVCGRHLLDALLPGRYSWRILRSSDGDYRVVIGRTV